MRDKNFKDNMSLNSITNSKQHVNLKLSNKVICILVRSYQRPS